MVSNYLGIIKFRLWKYCYWKLDVSNVTLGTTVLSHMVGVNWTCTCLSATLWGGCLWTWWGINQDQGHTLPGFLFIWLYLLVWPLQVFFSHFPLKQPHIFPSHKDTLLRVCKGTSHSKHYVVPDLLSNFIFCCNF